MSCSFYLSICLRTQKNLNLVTIGVFFGWGIGSAMVPSWQKIRHEMPNIIGYVTGSRYNLVWGGDGGYHSRDCSYYFSRGARWKCQPSMRGYWDRLYACILIDESNQCGDVGRLCIPVSWWERPIEVEASSVAEHCPCSRSLSLAVLPHVPCFQSDSLPLHVRMSTSGRVKTDTVPCRPHVSLFTFENANKQHCKKCKPLLASQVHNTLTITYL